MSLRFLKKLLISSLCLYSSIFADNKHTKTIAQSDSQQESMKEKSQSLKYENIIKKVFSEIENLNFDELMMYFAPNAIIDSPIHGKMKAKEYYTNLFPTLKSVKVSIKDTFVSLHNPNSLIGYIYLNILMKDGTKTKTESIDLFEFDSKSQKIKSIKFIWDTYPSRQAGTSH